MASCILGCHDLYWIRVSRFRVLERPSRWGTGLASPARFGRWESSPPTREYWYRLSGAARSIATGASARPRRAPPSALFGLRTAGRDRPRPYLVGRMPAGSREKVAITSPGPRLRPSAQAPSGSSSRARALRGPTEARMQRCTWRRRIITSPRGVSRRRRFGRPRRRRARCGSARARHAVEPTCCRPRPYRPRASDSRRSPRPPSPCEC